MTTQDVKKISIRLLPDGFSFFNQIYPIRPGADFNQRLKETLLDTISNSNMEQADINVCSVENARFCLSPLAISDEQACQMYELTLPSAEQEETLIHLSNESHGIRFTFGIDSQLYHFILRNWIGVSFTHPLFELFLQWVNRQEVAEDCMIAQNQDNSINLLVFKQGKLNLANRFETTSEDNIIYFLMNCWMQSELDVLDDKLFLITDSAEIRQKISQYIKQCES